MEEWEKINDKNIHKHSQERQTRNKIRYFLVSSATTGYSWHKLWRPGPYFSYPGLIYHIDHVNSRRFNPSVSMFTNLPTTSTHHQPSLWSRPDLTVNRQLVVISKKFWRHHCLSQLTFSLTFSLKTRLLGGGGAGLGKVFSLSNLISSRMLGN